MSCDWCVDIRTEQRRRRTTECGGSLPDTPQVLYIHIIHHQCTQSGAAVRTIYSVVRYQVVYYTKIYKEQVGLRFAGHAPLQLARPQATSTI